MKVRLREQSNQGTRRAKTLWASYSRLNFDPNVFIHLKVKYKTSRRKLVVSRLEGAEAWMLVETKMQMGLSIMGSTYWV